MTHSFFFNLFSSYVLLKYLFPGVKQQSINQSKNIVIVRKPTETILLIFQIMPLYSVRTSFVEIEAHILQNVLIIYFNLYVQFTHTHPLILYFI